MPKPHRGEQEDKFVSRCIPIVLNEGTAKDQKQAEAICYSIWKEHDKDKSTGEVEAEYKELKFNVSETKEDDEYYYVEGYGAASGNLDKVGDIIVNGGYKSTLEYVKSGGTIVANWMHDQRQPVGIWTVIGEDKKGLKAVAKLPKTDQFVRERVIPQVKVGSLKLSIGYNVVDKEYKDGVRYLKDIKIFEISFVGNPANDNAVITGYKSVDINTLENMSERDMESQFKSGFKASNQTAKLLVKLVKKYYQRDVDDAQRDVEFNEFDKVVLENYKNSFDAITKSLKK